MRYSDDERRRRRAHPASVATGGIPAHALSVGLWLCCAAAASCQAASAGRAGRESGTARSSALPAEPAPPPAGAEAAGARAPAGPPGAPQPVPVEVGRPGPDSPEVIAGRDRMSAQLAALKSRFLEGTRLLLGTPGGPRIADLAALGAKGAEAIAGRKAADGDLAAVLREAGMRLALCRSFATGTDACALAESLDPGGAHRCRALRRVLSLAKAVGDRKPLEDAAAELDLPPGAADGIDAVFVRERPAACAGIRSLFGGEDWMDAACRAVAGRDTGVCETLEDARWRSPCRAVAEASLALAEIDQLPENVQARDAAMLLRWAAKPADLDRCVDDVLEWLGAHAALDAVFGLPPLEPGSDRAGTAAAARQE